MAKGKEFVTTISLKGKVDKSLGTAFSKVQGMAKGISGTALKVAGAGFAAAGAAAVAASKEMFDLGESFQEASNTIRRNTGATGKALEELNKSFDEVYKSVPTTMEAASQAIADWNTRLGVTGNTLETLSKQSLYVSDMMGEDLTGVIESSSQALKQWNIDAEGMEGEMDYIFKVCQNTGMGFNVLMGHMQSSGAVLQDLGYNFDEAAVMIANLDKAGINTEQVLKGMKKGLGNIAKDGGDAVAAMNEYAEAIRNAESESEAITIATDIFGSATAVTMAQAIRTGAMDVDALTASLKANDETIMKAAEDTETFPQKLQKLKASAEVALKPVANGFLDIAMKAIPAISDAVETVIPIISDGMNKIAPIMDNVTSTVIPMISSALQFVIPMISDMVSMMETGFGQISGVFNDVFPMITDTATSLLPSISEMIGNILGLMGDMSPLFDSIMNGVKSIASTVYPLLSGIITALMGIINRIMPYIRQAVQMVVPIISGVIDTVTSVLSTAGEVITNNILPGVDTLAGAFLNVYDAISPILQTVFECVQRLIPLLAPYLQNVLSILGNLFSNVLVPIGEWLLNGLANNIRNMQPIISGILTVVTTVAEGMTKAFTGVTDFLSDVFAGNWKRIWEGIKSTFTGIWESLKGVVRGVISAIVKGINSVITGVNGFIAKTPAKALEAVGLNIKIPTIPLPQFANGGTVTSPTLAMVGEGGNAETIIPHTNTARSRSLLNTAAAGVYGSGASVAGGNTDSRTYNFTFAPVVQGSGLTDSSFRNQYEQFKRQMNEWLAEHDREVFA